MSTEELTIIQNNIVVPGEHEVLVGGPFLGTLLGRERVREVAENISAVLSTHTDRTIPVSAATLEAGIHQGVSAAVIGLNENGLPEGPIYGFARFKDHEVEGGEVLEEGVELYLPTAIEAGSMLGNKFALVQGRPVNPNVVGGQGRRAIEAVVHLAQWEHPERHVMAATNQTNPQGAEAVIRAGGVKAGYKPITRLEHPSVKQGEKPPSGPVLVDIYKMESIDRLTPYARRGRAVSIPT